MNFFKLLLVFTLVLFGTFAQRFLRHSINDVALIDGKDSDDNLLSSDGLNAQQFDGDVKLTGYAKEIELELDELKFEFCSKRNLHYIQVCMRQKVSVCYDAETPPLALQGDCGPNQCRFEAGILGGDGENLLWLMMYGYATTFSYFEDICATAIIQSPKAEVTSVPPFPSCEPSIINGKIKLSVKIATTECFLTVKNAKIWTPKSPLPATQSPADKGAKKETSNAAIIGIIVGVILFILLIGIIAAGVWYFCIRKQKKTSEKKKIVVETPKHTVEADVVKEKHEEKKEPAEPKMTKEDTKEKKKAVEKEKASKPKEIKEQKIQPKPSKEVPQENVTKEIPPKKQASVEPTLDDSIADASIVQAQQQPHVFVPKTVIYPAPLQPPSKGITQYSRSSSRKGSLSGRHEIGIMAESTSETVKRALDTESGMEEESSQVSITRASEKNRKKKSGEKK
uniref:Uncharacterized protein n=1 Tax=Panagrolaimus davidi TaxID=227884 RepID=A0A914PWK5_9BILA